MTRKEAAFGIFLILCLTFTAAQATSPPDLTKPTLYMVGYAHLDTQWRWTYPTVIRQYLANTLHDNFALIDRYPDYVFNFTGARRYALMKEYFPADFERLRGYVRAGRWFPAGASVDECDTLSPSAESLVRQVLYGNEFFRDEFGVESHDVMLPDSFGFNAGIPTILAHCGIAGFSTQKLSWGSAVGIPFKVGIWRGPDGRSVIAAFDPGTYGGKIDRDLSNSDMYLNRINQTGKASGVYVDYRYYGTGDRGGAPAESSVQMLQRSLAGHGPVHVISARSDQMYMDITDAQKAKLPRYTGELLLTWHSAGSLSSQAYMKRWNRRNEQLADAAEHASVLADWLGAAPYPFARLHDAWFLVLGSQMHDMMAGTAMANAYEYTWNDEILAMNQFAAAEADAASAVCSSIDTRDANSTPDARCIVVYNPLSFERDDVAEANVQYPSRQDVPAEVGVIGPDGKMSPAQIIGRTETSLRILFGAHVPPVSFSAYQVVAAPAAASQELQVTDRTLENARFRLTLDNNGDIASIFDKSGQREFLAKPIRLAFLHENPTQYPAWNMDYADRMAAPYAFAGAPTATKIVEQGPVRAAIEVGREAQGSRIVQQIRLASGPAGDRIEICNRIDWQTQQSSLEATIPLTCANPQATYDVQAGVVQRGKNNPRKYEVPQQQWFDLTDPSGKFGAAILNDSKYGSDKPDDQTLRLTLLYTPGTRGRYCDQGTQDIGRHDIVYAVAPHDGDWRDANVPQMAARLNQPLRTFQSPAHPGSLGKQFSLISIDSPNVMAAAIKKSESGDRIIVRLRETCGRPTTVRIRTAIPALSCDEVDGQEREIAPVTIIQQGAESFTVNLQPYDMRAYALKLTPPGTQLLMPIPKTQPVALRFDTDAVSPLDHPNDGAFDAAGRTYPAEDWPRQLNVDAIPFSLGSPAEKSKSALRCRGQQITLPPGAWERLYVLAASSDGDQPARFTAGDRTTDITIQDWTDKIGQWDHRLWKEPYKEVDYDWINQWNGLEPGYIKPAEVAWYSSHRHHPRLGDEVYDYCYLFKYAIDLPTAANGPLTLTLPNNPRICLFAMTLASAAHDAATPAIALGDTLGDRSNSDPSIEPPGGKFDGPATITIHPPLYWEGSPPRYTLDGSDPTASSPIYSGPFELDAPATVKVRQLDESGRFGPSQTAAAAFIIHDIVPPRVVSAIYLPDISELRIEFSKRMNPDSLSAMEDFKLEPALPIRSATPRADGRSVVLQLAQAPAAGATLKLSIVRARDASPSGNALPADAMTVPQFRPVYQQPGGLLKDANVPGLPVRAGDAWTLNLFCKPDGQIPDRTIIAGFGLSDGKADGTGRYIAHFPHGLHFWAANQDVDSDVPIRAGQWQMLTATYDGQTLRLYKNGELAAQGQLTLGDDESTVKFAPRDPWDNARIYNGAIQGMSIWKCALPTEALKLMWDHAQSALPMGAAGFEPATKGL